VKRRLEDLYRGVAVHATADLEHQAALELLALMVLVDDEVTDEELGLLRDLSTDWRDDGATFEQHVRPAIDAARRAIDDDRVEDLLDTVDSRISSRVLRGALFSAARDLAGTDDHMSTAEGSLLAAIAVRFA